MKNFAYLFVLTFLVFNCSSEDEGIETNDTIPGPFSVTILETRMDGANIEWTEAIDIDGDAITYSIYLDDVLISTGGTVRTYNFTGLEPEISYEGYIIADDGRGGTSQDDFFFLTEPELIVVTLQPTFWINESYPEAGGTRYVYGNGFLVPKNVDATSYQIEVIDFRYDDYPYFVGSVFTWTNDYQNPDYIKYNVENNEFRVQLTSTSVNTLNPEYDDFYANVIGSTGEAQVLISF